jgi:hypothetical protein
MMENGHIQSFLGQKIKNIIGPKHRCGFYSAVPAGGGECLLEMYVAQATLLGREYLMRKRVWETTVKASTRRD